MRNLYYKNLLHNNPDFHNKTKQYHRVLRQTKYKEKENSRERTTYSYYTQILQDYFGLNCQICGKPKHNELFDLHQKYGMPHKKRRHQIYEQKEDFILLCKPCHRAVHWAMNYLHLSWEEIISLCRNQVVLSQLPLSVVPHVERQDAQNQTAPRRQ
jgi:hypothetical protein